MPSCWDKATLGNTKSHFTFHISKDFVSNLIDANKYLPPAPKKLINQQLRNRFIVVHESKKLKLLIFFPRKLESVGQYFPRLAIIQQRVWSFGKFSSMQVRRLYTYFAWRKLTIPSVSTSQWWVNVCSFGKQFKEKKNHPSRVLNMKILANVNYEWIQSKEPNLQQEGIGAFATFAKRWNTRGTWMNFAATCSIIDRMINLLKFYWFKNVSRNKSGNKQQVILAWSSERDMPSDDWCRQQAPLNIGGKRISKNLKSNPSRAAIYCLLFSRFFFQAKFDLIMLSSIITARKTASSWVEMM